MISADSPYDLLKGLPLEGAKGREQLNNFIKRVRLGQLSLEELVAGIRAFEIIIYCGERVSPAYGGLLGHLFSQLESNWRGEVLGHDIRSIQLILLRKILHGKGQVANLAIWTAGLKEIRMLSGAAKEFVITWILGNVEGSDESDWSIIFHNLILMAACSGPLLTKIFEVIDECLGPGRESRSLQDHLIFLIGQNASLGKMWIKWILARGAFKIGPLVFSGLLSLSQLDTDYCNTLTGALQANIRLMSEISLELQRVNYPIVNSVISVKDYLKRVAGWIESDSEMGIRGALQLIDALKMTMSEDMTEFYLELFRLHPFARRELLCHQDGLKVWRRINEIDPIILKEHLKENREKIINVSVETPELLCNLIEHEDEICEDMGIEALMAIDSIVLFKALKHRDTLCNSHINTANFNIPLNWNEMSIGEISVLKTRLNNNSNDGMFTAKMVELCELLLVPDAIDSNRDHLIDLAVEFISNSADVFNEKERISMVSKLIASQESRSEITSYSRNYTGKSFLRLFERNGIDWNNYAGTLKYVLERISVSSEEFYKLISRVPVSVEFQILTAKAIFRVDLCDLNAEVAQFIGNMAGRVVSEPQLSKYLQALLSRKYTGCDQMIPITKFTEISDPGMIKSVVEFGLEYGCIEGLKGEIIKSILMYYGIIEEESDNNSASTVNSGNSSLRISITPSRFKNVHLSEKSVNFALTALLNTVQRDLEMAHKLIKSVPDVIVTRDVDEYLRVWLDGSVSVFVGLTRGLISGRGAMRLHSLLASFYELCTKLVQMRLITAKSVQMVQVVSGQLNRQVYAMIPLQQEKIQSVLKQEISLKKDKSTSTGNNGNNGKSITKLIYEMEKFEENLIRRVRGGDKWCDRIVRSTARDFKIRLEQL